MVQMYSSEEALEPMSSLVATSCRIIIFVNNNLLSRMIDLVAVCPSVFMADFYRISALVVHDEWQYYTVKSIKERASWFIILLESFHCSRPNHFFNEHIIRQMPSESTKLLVIYGDGYALFTDSQGWILYQNNCYLDVWILSLLLSSMF